MVDTVLNSFCVENCLTSLPCINESKQFLFKKGPCYGNGLATSHLLLLAARSGGAELWLNHNKTDPIEGALGLSWHCGSDTMGNRHTPILYQSLILKNVYKVLASQYDPLGYIILFIIRKCSRSLELRTTNGINL